MNSTSVSGYVAQATAFILVFLTIFSVMVAWVAHVMGCIKAGAWILLIIGIFVPPIGWVHGFMVLFGI